MLSADLLPKFADRFRGKILEMVFKCGKRSLEASKAGSSVQWRGGKRVRSWRAVRGFSPKSICGSGYYLICLSLCCQYVLAETLDNILHKEAFRPTQTIDGVQVQFIALPEVPAEGVAKALYKGAEALITYDENLFKTLGPLARFLILEHERAHHELGHTLITKLRREQSKIASHFEYARVEKDADCYSGYVLADLSQRYDFSMSAQQIEDAMLEIYLKISSSHSAEKPPNWLLKSIDTVRLCFQGELLPRPKTLPIPNELLAEDD